MWISLDTFFFFSFFFVGFFLFYKACVLGPVRVRFPAVGSSRFRFETGKNPRLLFYVFIPLVCAVFHILRKKDECMILSFLWRVKGEGVINYDQKI